MDLRFNPDPLFIKDLSLNKRCKFHKGFRFKSDSYQDASKTFSLANFACQTQDNCQKFYCQKVLKFHFFKVTFATFKQSFAHMWRVANGFDNADLDLYSR